LQHPNNEKNNHILLIVRYLIGCCKKSAENKKAEALQADLEDQKAIEELLKKTVLRKGDTSVVVGRCHNHTLHIGKATYPIEIIVVPRRFVFGVLGLGCGILTYFIILQFLHLHHP